MQAEIAEDQHIEDQLELAAEDLRQATTSDQDETIGWIVATLPRAGVNAQAWGRWNPDFNKPGQGEIAETPALTYIGPERDLRPVRPKRRWRYRRLSDGKSRLTQFHGRPDGRGQPDGHPGP